MGLSPSSRDNYLDSICLWDYVTWRASRRLISDGGVRTLMQPFVSPLGCSGFPNVDSSPLKIVPTLEQGSLPIATYWKPDFLGQNTGNSFSICTLPHSTENRDLWITEFIILKECDLFIVSDILSQIWKSVNVLFILKENETSSSSHPRWPADWDIILLPLQIQLNCELSLCPKDPPI